jgi:hypothetical protein
MTESNCRVEVLANTADAIAALSKLKDAEPRRIADATTAAIERFEVRPGLHETVAALLMVIKWSDLAYGAAGSLIAAGILAVGGTILKARPPAAANVRGHNSDEPTTARVEMADAHAILRIELKGYEAEATAEVIRTILGRDAS